jgi:hypothetical protein
VAGVRSIAAAAIAALLLVPRCAPPPPIDAAAFFSSALLPGETRVDSLASWLVSGRIDVQIDGRRGAGRMRVIYARPERVRADLELGGAFGLLGSRAVFWVDANEAYWQEGAGAPVRVTADEILAPVLGGQVGVLDLEVLLFGLARLRARWPADSVIEVRGRGGEDVVTALFPGGVREEATVSGNPRALRRLERRDPEGKTIFVARFDRIRGVEGVLAAARLELRAPVAGNWLRIDWSTQRADPELPAETLAWPSR